MQNVTSELSQGVAFRCERAPMIRRSGIHGLEGTQSSENKREASRQCFSQTSHSSAVFNMVHKLYPGQYYIVSVVNDRYLGVCGDTSPTCPPPPPAPVVVLSPEYKGTKFTVEAGNFGDYTFTIRAEYANTLGLGERVFALTNEPAEDWVIHYRESMEAYTIERAFSPRTWTVPPEEPGFDRQVLLNTLIFQPSEHGPQYLPSQLFKFVPVNKE
ncbi:hypothetical protein PISMIDRAFT_197077 [Pisolithus microcarpus 441]|uniref:Uncharacterized protein n=1 Tax=Pisolithus microcarpus 441 TaxID=765257 RepID=A0A0C9Y0B8_9AGAM|nr:hypothetical protein PISMIDRAFT_197077 [Pisolithus microcarpus 441]